MNETLKMIESRKSLRTYSKKEMTRKEKDTIIRAAMRAPTAGNMMLYTMIEVEDQKKKERLVETCDHQPFIARAPLVLLFLADYQRHYDYFVNYDVGEYCIREGRTLRTPGEGDLLLACCDALIAAQNAVIAAESMGFGSCYIGDIMENYEIHREMFDLPDFVFPITMVCFGPPPDSYAVQPPVPRFDQEFVHFRDSYKRLDKEDFERMYAPLEATLFRGISLKNNAENLAQHMFARKYDSDFAKEMNRSVREAVKIWQRGSLDS